MANYYLNTASTGSGDGTTQATTGANAAWAAISEITGLAAGDTVSFNKGNTWREQLTVPTSGSSGSVITFNAYGDGANPIINGADIISTWTDYPGAWSEIWSAESQTSDSSWSDVGPVGVDRNYRIFIKNASITASATTIRIKFIANTGLDLVIEDCSVGAKKASSDEFDFASAPTNVQQGSSDNFTITGGTSGYSDSISFTMDSGTDYLVAVNVPDPHNYSTLTGSSPEIYYKTTADDETEIEDVTGYDASGLMRYVESIESLTAVANVWKATLTTEPYHVFFDGVKGALQASAAACTSAGHWFWDSNVLYVYHTQDPDGDIVIEAGARRQCIYSSAKDYITIDGIDLKYAGGVNVDSDNLSASNCDYWNIQNLTTQYAFQDGIAIHGGGDNNIVTSVVAHHNGNSTNEGNGIIADGTGTDDGTITSCTSYNNQGDGVVIHGPDGGTAIDGWTVSSCTCYSNGEQGIELYAASNCIVDGNICYSNGTVQTANGHGIGNNGTTDGATTRNVNNIIRYNKCYSSAATGGGEISNYYISGAQVYYNLVYSPGLYGISALDNTTNNVTIYNNVVYNTQNQDAIRIQAIDSATICTVKNNIVDTVHASYYAIDVNADSTSYVITDYNCVDGVAADHYVNWGGSGYDLADYITNTTNGDNSIESDPLMADPASDDFTLQLTSPCINTGTDVSLTTDYAGEDVTVPPNIGAYETLPPGGGGGLGMTMTMYQT